MNPKNAATDLDYIAELHGGSTRTLYNVDIYSIYKRDISAEKVMDLVPEMVAEMRALRDENTELQRINREPCSALVERDQLRVEIERLTGIARNGDMPRYLEAVARMHAAEAESARLNALIRAAIDMAEQLGCECNASEQCQVCALLAHLHDDASETHSAICESRLDSSSVSVRGTAS